MKTNITAAPVRATKNEVCALLRKFINSRPGLDFANYGDYASYRAEIRGITRQRADALAILRAVELRDGITVEMIREAFPRAFSGRLELVETDGEPIALNYCAGQYYPTEYRAAAAAVLASVLWGYWRANMPAPVYVQHGKAGEPMSTEARYNGKSAGEYLRGIARSEFGRGIQSRFFN